MMKKPRELWVIDSEMKNCPDGKTRFARTENPEADGVDMAQFIHVREVIDDGSIRVTREMVMEARENCRAKGFASSDIWQELKKLSEGK